MKTTNVINIMKHMLDFIDFTLEERTALTAALGIVKKYENALDEMNDRLVKDYYTTDEEDDVLRNCIELLTEGEDD